MTDGVERTVAGGVADLVSDLFDEERATAIVAITERHGQPLVGPERLAAAIGASARLVLLGGDAADALGDALPDKLGVFGGACRIWWTGLVRTSDPYDHPLVWVTPGQGERAEVRIRELLDERRRAARRELREGDEVEGVVVAIDPQGASIDVQGTTTYAHRNYLVRETLDDPRDVLRVGQRVRARVGRVTGGKDAQLDLRPFQGDAWMTLADQVRPGDIVRGRIARWLAQGGALIQLLPGVTAIVPRHLSVVDRRSPSPGETVAVRVVSVEAHGRRATLSLSDAPAETDGAVPVRLLTEGAVFLAPDAEVAVQAASELDRLRAEVEGLRAELENARDQIGQLEDDRSRLRADLRALRERVRANRGTTLVKPRAADAQEDFLEAVRDAYQRLYPAADQERYPLGEIRLGPRFLASVRVLEGIDPQRIVDVCAHVAANRAHRISSLEVHQLRAGKGGAPQMERRDGAKAWRVSLQVNTPSARRLHYWVLPSVDGRVVEFDAVGVHDELE